MQISLDLSRYAPEFEIILSGAVNQEARKSAVSVQISEQLGDAAQYTLILSDTFDVPRQQFIWLDNKVFDIGNTVGIDIFYANKKSERTKKPMIQGPIKSFSTSGFSGDVPKLTLVGYDTLHGTLTDKTTAENSVNPGNKDTYSEIAEKISSAAGMESEIDKTIEYSPVITKKSVTYSEFLHDIARRVGYDFFSARGTFYFINLFSKKNKVGNAKSYEWGKDLMQFTPTINTTDLVSSVEVRGHLPNSKKPIVGTAETGVETTFDSGIKASEIAPKLNKDGKKNTRTIQNMTFSSQQEADDIAKAELERTGWNLVTGSGTMVGDPGLLPGMTIEMKRLGKRFSGHYIITSVTNTIDGNGYTTSFNARRNVLGDVT